LYRLVAHLGLSKADFTVKSKSKSPQKLTHKRRGSPLQKKHESGNEVSQLRQQLEIIQRELAEGQSRKNATTEILGVIAGSPTELQPVLDAIVESAARVCGIDDVLLRLVENEFMVPRAFRSDADSPLPDPN